MTQNPYAQSDLDAASDIDLVEPDRTSLLAVGSLVCSLICCIPGLGVLGSLLGIGAIVGIGKSRGRLGGKALAIVGLILGLVVTAAWVGVAIAVQAGIAQLGQYGQFVTALENDDVASARTYLSPLSTVTDEEILTWSDGFEVVHGRFVSQPTGAVEFFQGMVGTVGQNPQAMTTAQQGYPGGSILPMTLEMDNGPALMFIVMDNMNQTSGGMPAILDIAYDDGSGTLIWLVREPQEMLPMPGTPPMPTAESIPADSTDAGEATSEDTDDGSTEDSETDDPDGG